MRENSKTATCISCSRHSETKRSTNRQRAAKNVGFSVLDKIICLVEGKATSAAKVCYKCSLHTHTQRGSKNAIYTAFFSLLTKACYDVKTQCTISWPKQKKARHTGEYTQSQLPSLSPFRNQFVGGIGTSLCTVHLLTDLDDLVPFLKDLVRRSGTCDVRDCVTGFPVILESHCEDANSKDKCFTRTRQEQLVSGGPYRQFFGRRGRTRAADFSSWGPSQGNLWHQRCPPVAREPFSGGAGSAQQ